MTPNENKKGGRRLKENIKRSSDQRSDHTNNYENNSQGTQGKEKWSTKKKLAVILGSIGAVAAVIAISALFMLNWFNTARETPPALRREPTAPREPVQSANPEPGNTADDNVYEGGSEEVVSLRNESKYTFLVLGIDVLSGEVGNSDAIMVMTFDVENLTLDVVNIPRDTLVNVSWDLKKANSIYSNMRLHYRGQENAEMRAMEATVSAFGDILGFEVDYFAVMNFRAVERLIDAVGGINFYVPATISHVNELTVERGQQRLNGEQAVVVLRNRNFATADIGRVMITQSFLSEAARQIIAQRNNIQITSIANIFLNNVATDMSLDDLIFFANAFLQISPDDIRFHMLPGFVDTMRGSFVAILLDEWLAMLNTYISPFNFEKTAEDVSILTRGADRRLFVTDGQWQGSSQWRADTTGPANPRNIATYGTPTPTGVGTTGTGGGGGATAPAAPIVCDDCGQNPCVCCIICGYPCSCDEVVTWDDDDDDD